MDLAQPVGSNVVERQGFVHGVGVGCSAAGGRQGEDRSRPVADLLIDNKHAWSALSSKLENLGKSKACLMWASSPVKSTSLPKRTTDGPGLTLDATGRKEDGGRKLYSTRRRCGRVGG